MEARLYAENPTTGFLPSTGLLRHLRFPQGIRVDAGVEQGGEVTGFYDPMIAKLIVHAPDRRSAARRLAAGCAAVEVWPVKSNAAFLARVAGDEAFVAGQIDTGFIERRAASLIPAAEPSEEVVRAAAGALLSRHASDPWSALMGFRPNAPRLCEGRRGRGRPQLLHDRRAAAAGRVGGDRRRPERAVPARRGVGHRRARRDARGPQRRGVGRRAAIAHAGPHRERGRAPGAGGRQGAAVCSRSRP